MRLEYCLVESAQKVMMIIVVVNNPYVVLAISIFTNV